LALPFKMFWLPPGKSTIVPTLEKIFPNPMKILANYYQYAISGVVNGENVRDAISLLKESALSFSNNTFFLNARKWKLLAFGKISFEVRLSEL